MKNLLLIFSCCATSLVIADAELDLILLNNSLIELSVAQRQQALAGEQPMMPATRRTACRRAQETKATGAELKTVVEEKGKRATAAEEKKIIAGLAVARPVAQLTGPTPQEIKQQIAAGHIAVAQPTQPVYRAADVQPERNLPAHMPVAQPVTAPTAVRPNRQKITVTRVAAAHQQKRHVDQQQHPAQLVETKAVAAEVKQQAAALLVAQPVAQVVMQPAAAGAQPTAEVKKQIEDKKIAVAAPVVQPVAPAKKTGFFAKLFGN